MEDQIHGLEDSFNQAMDDAKEMTKKIQSIPSSKYFDSTILCGITFNYKYLFTIVYTIICKTCDQKFMKISFNMILSKSNTNKCSWKNRNNYNHLP